MGDGRTPRFELHEEPPPVDTLAVGFTEYGLAGLTAVDYLTDQLPMEQVGYLNGAGPPSITPFEAGEPRHHTRVYVDEVESLAVVVGERFVPPGEAVPVTDALSGLWTDLDPTSLTVLTGVPVAHGPEDHAPFYIATEDYRERYLADAEIRPMGTGFLDGVTAELVARGIPDDDWPVGVFTTPAHPQAPDAAAAIRLVDALSTTHDVDVDTGPLESFAADVEAQYRELADRVEAAREDRLPDDRMYM